MEEIDRVLKNIFEEDGSSSEQDIEKKFLKLKRKLLDSENKRNDLWKFRCRNFKKLAVGSICGLLCAAAILVGSSSTVRAATLSALDSIKSIFVVEGYGKDAKIVQKPTNENSFILSNGHNTSRSDAELEKILGYKAIYPDNLAGGFELKCRVLNVMLGKKLSYDSIPAISEQLGKAIESQEEFAKLAEYSPFRTVSGSYQKGDTHIYIYAEPEQLSAGFDSTEKEDEEIEVGNIKGFLHKFIYPEYPYKNGASDMSVEPVLKDAFSIYWVSKGVRYSLSPLVGDVLSKEEAIKLAEDFQAAQP